MARTLTGSVSRVAAQAPPRPPPALVFPLAPRLHLVVAVAEEESVLLMARASTGGVGRVLAQEAPHPPACLSSPWRRDCIRLSLSLRRSPR